jgi:hypothetical protein
MEPLLAPISFVCTNLHTYVTVVCKIFDHAYVAIKLKASYSARWIEIRVDRFFLVWIKCQTRNISTYIYVHVGIYQMTKSSTIAIVLKIPNDHKNTYKMFYLNAFKNSTKLRFTDCKYSIWQPKQKLLHEVLLR